MALLSLGQYGFTSSFGKGAASPGEILAKAAYFGLKTEAEVLTEEAFTTAAIEGETINRDSIRSSVARRLGLPACRLWNDTLMDWLRC